MSFYQSINKYYDNIFPLNFKQVEFVKSFFEENATLIEVGCANGKLTNALSDFEIMGIDLESSFIKEASQRYPHIKFRAMNMLDLDSLNQRFDGIVCVGNTLVHLDKEQIGKFIEKANASLNPRGKLLLQILNYDFIVEKEITELPLIDNDVITFKRTYSFEDTLKFKTKLSIKESNEVIENVINLHPIGKFELEEVLKHNGFEEITFYSSFAKDEYTFNKLPLVISAQKKS